MCTAPHRLPSAELQLLLEELCGICIKESNANVSMSGYPHHLRKASRAASLGCRGVQERQLPRVTWHADLPALSPQSLENVYSGHECRASAKICR